MAPTQEKVEKFGGHTPLGRPARTRRARGFIYVQLAMADGEFRDGPNLMAGRRKRATLIERLSECDSELRFK